MNDLLTTVREKAKSLKKTIVLDEVCRLGADNIFCMMSGSKPKVLKKQLYLPKEKNRALLPRQQKCKPKVLPKSYCSAILKL